MEKYDCSVVTLESKGIHDHVRGLPTVSILRRIVPDICLFISRFPLVRSEPGV